MKYEDRTKRMESLLTLYEQRNEDALRITNERYGAYCLSIARNILGDEGEAQECVNDTWLKAWQTIPPKKPNSLKLYLAGITRNLSFNRYKEKTRAKRGGNETALVLDELSEIADGNEDVEKTLIRQELREAIERFLLTLSKRDSDIFVCRYFYTQSQSQIAKRFGLKEGNVRLILLRTRNALKDFLKKEHLL